MPANNNPTDVPYMNRRIINTDIRGYFHSNYLRWLQWLSGWQARWQKKESRPSLEMDYELSNEQYAEGGDYHISPQQATLERMIGLGWVRLRMKRNL